MSEAVAPSAPAAAPQARIQVNGEAPKTPLHGDALTNSLLDGIEFSEAPGTVDDAINAQQAELNKNLPGKPRKAVAEQDAPAEEGAELAPEADEETEAAEEQPILPRDRGTKDKPLKHTELPDTYMIERKVDGKREVVSLKEAVQDGIRGTTFNRAYTGLQNAMNEAKAVTERAKQTESSFRQGFQDLMNDPEHLTELLLEHHPQTLEAAAKNYALLKKHWRDNPGSEAEFRAQMKERQLNKRQQEFDQQQQTARQKAEQERAFRESQAKMGPAVAEGLRQLGFPDGTKLSPKFRETVHVLIEGAKRANRGVLLPEDITEAIVRAGQLHPPEQTVAARKPAPASPPSAPRGQKQDFSKMSRNQKVGSSDFFLSGTKYDR